MITKEQFMSYERVRQSGKTNMFIIKNVEALSGLSRDVIMEIMENYSLLFDEYIEDNYKEEVKA